MKISLLFLTSETLDFESEYVFESHKHLQSTVDLMPALICIYVDQIGPNVGQIGPNQAQTANFESRSETSVHCTFLRILTTTSAYIISFEFTTVTKWVNWNKNGLNVGPKWFYHYRLLTSIR